MRKTGLLLVLVILLCALAPAICTAEGEDATPGDAAQEAVATIGNMGNVVIERKQTMTLAIPVTLRVGGSYWYSNMLDSGSIVNYDPTRSAVGYSGDIFSALTSLSVEIVQEGNLPFYKQTIASRRYVVSTLSDSTAQQLGFEKVEGGYRDPMNGAVYPTGTRYNAGFAVFEGLTVHADVRNGAYDIPVRIRWESDVYGSGREDVVLRATAENSDVEVQTGGGSTTYHYSGGSGTKATPEAKLMVQSVSTNPESPMAGDEFDLVLKLYNTSSAETVSNITLECEAEGDAILPVSGAFSAYVESIGPNRALEQRFRVRAQSDIQDKPVKIYVTIDYEDKNAGAHSVSQTVVVNVSQLIRVRLDDPVMPSDVSIVGESYPVSMGVFNLGRTTLYNVTVAAVSGDANLSTGAAYYCGNMDSGTGKTAELRLTPLAEGFYSVELEVTYENGRGESFAETKTVQFYSESYEEEDWFAPLEDFPGSTPEPGPGRMAIEVAAILPWWVYGFVGCMFVLAVVCVGVSVRHRRIRALEDDEME